MIKKRKNTYAFIFEVTLYNVLIFLFLFYLRGNSVTFLSANLHPFFILVAIFSWYYGTWFGVISSFIVTLFYFLAYLLSGKDVILFFLDIRYFKFPTIFFFTSVVVGKVSDRVREKYYDYEKEIKDKNKSYKKLDYNYKRLYYYNNRLKEQIITSDTSIISLYEISEKLNSLSPEKIYTEVLLIMKKFIGSEIASIYSYSSGSNYLRLKVKSGLKNKYPNSINIEEFPELKEVIETQNIYKGDIKDYKKPVFISPILYKDKVDGILIIDKLRFKHYGAYTEKMFIILSKWLSNALGNAIHMAKTNSKNIRYPSSDLFTLDYFVERLKEEKRREEVFELEHIHFEFKLKKEVTLADISQKLEKNIRVKDLVSYNKETSKLLVLFPATEKKYEALVKERLKTLLNEYLEDEYEY